MPPQEPRQPHHLDPWHTKYFQIKAGFILHQLNFYFQMYRVMCNAGYAEKDFSSAFQFLREKDDWLTPLLKNWYDWEQFRMWMFLDGSRPWACVVYTVKTVENRRCNVALQLSVFPYEPCWHRLAHWDMTIGWFLFSNVWNFKFGMLPSWCIFAYTRLA